MTTRTFTHEDCVFRLPRASEWPVWAARLSQHEDHAAAIGVHLDLLASLLQTPHTDDPRDWLDLCGPSFVAGAVNSLMQRLNPSDDTAGK